MAMAALESRDWSRILPELVQEIAGHLTEIPDRIRFRWVCVRWRSATESIARPPRQLPWLLLPIKYDRKSPNFNPDCHRDPKYKRRLWSVAENRIYELPLIDCIRSSLLASSRVWITELSPTYLVPLPPSLPPLPDGRRPRAIRKAKVFSSSFPSSYDIFIAMMLDKVVFCRPWETSWKQISTLLYLSPRFFALHDNRFFAFDLKTGVVSVFDIDTVQKTREIPVPDGYGPEVLDVYQITYLVEMPSGELLLVIREEIDPKNRTFRLFRLDKMKFEWVKISSIGNNVLFLDGNQATAFDACGLTYCKRNTIYFLDTRRRFILLFDLEKGRTEEAPIFEVKVDPSGSSSVVWPHAAYWIVPTIC